MIEDINKINNEVQSFNSSSLDEIENFRISFLGKKGKITFGGIPHKAYWFDLKRNHFSIIVDVLNEVCPHLGPFNKKTIIFQENEESDESKPLQSENPSETFKLKATSENSLWGHLITPHHSPLLSPRAGSPRFRGPRKAPASRRRRVAP